MEEGRRHGQKNKNDRGKVEMVMPQKLLGEDLFKKTAMIRSCVDMKNNRMKTVFDN